MKANMQILLSAVVVLLSLTTINCGSSSSSAPPAAVTAYGAQCGAANSGMIQSPWGCLPSCGANAVYYQNQCQPFNATGGQFGVSNGTSSAAMCQGGVCPSGQVLMANGQCYPQGTCGACYGTPDGVTCYIGVYAHNYYGY